ncbi:hypothetical protein TrRE_jg941 [Triparma retinervis]|uniref:Peptidyl-prolyl cis-trans isomerase n=1 Tax=Triparma retinervis TaxID=2557542 RepID=A0A9W6ZRU4_9STRA|nr:hypothetical protein TrRE_jg941 [Triparma retinervis]
MMLNATRRILPSTLRPPLSQRHLTSSNSPSPSSTSPVLLVGFALVAGGVVYASNNYSKLASSVLPTSTPVEVSSSGLSQPQGKVTSRVYFDVEYGPAEYGPAKANLKRGRVNIGLYGEKAPRTCKNFEALCTTGVPKPSSGGQRFGAGVPFNEDQGANRGFRNTPLHRIIPGFMIQGGDITLGNGMGGASLYGDQFEDEDFTYLHRGGGVLSMANRGRNTNSSQFFITLADASWLDGKHCVFGVVEDEKSWRVCKEIEKCGSRSGDVRGTVRIVEAGICE